MTHSLDGQGLLRRKLAGASLLLLAGCGGGNTEKDEDAVAPSLVISSDVPGEAAGPFTVRFTFSAAVANFATNRILITNGFLNGATVTKVSDTVYSLAVTPTSNKQDLLTLQVLAGAFQDASGAASSLVAYSFSQRIDTVVASNEPLLTITNSAAGSVVATGPVTFTFDFSLDVGTSFTADDIVLSVGTVTSFTRNSGTRCTAVVTLPAGTSGPLRLDVVSGAFASTAGVASQQDYSTGVLFAIPA
jgi:large repetitive protein